MWLNTYFEISKESFMQLETQQEGLWNLLKLRRPYFLSEHKTTFVLFLCIKYKSDLIWSTIVNIVYIAFKCCNKPPYSKWQHSYQLSVIVVDDQHYKFKQSLKQLWRVKIMWTLYRPGRKWGNLGKIIASFKPINVH